MPLSLYQPASCYTVGIAILAHAQSENCAQRSRRENPTEALKNNFNRNYILILYTANSFDINVIIIIIINTIRAYYY